MNPKNIGSSFDDWLREEGFYEQATAVAIERVTARQRSTDESNSPSAARAGISAWPERRD